MNANLDEKNASTTSTVSFRSRVVKRAKRLLVISLTTVAIFYIFLVVMMVLSENQLVYPAPKYPKGNWQPGSQFEEVSFSSADGTKLVGWYLHHEQARGVVLFCHGNGENVAYVNNFAQRLREDYQLSVLSFDYRGYGKSEGKPNETGICEDGRAALDWLTTRNEIEDRDVILMGRSLGGGVVVRLASESDCRALVLINTFSSMPEAAATHYPFLPVRILMRNRFPSIKRIPQCDQPLLQIHGEEDQIAPLSQAKKLFEASPSSSKQLHIMPRCGHNSPLPQKGWIELGNFLDSLPGQLPSKLSHELPL